MEKIVLFTFVFLATVVMIHGTFNNTTTTASPPTSPHSNASTAEPTAQGGTTTKEPSASAVIQPLAIFVLACAFLGLMH